MNSDRSRPPPTCGGVRACDVSPRAARISLRVCAPEPKSSPSRYTRHPLSTALPSAPTARRAIHTAGYVSASSRPHLTRFGDAHCANDVDRAACDGHIRHSHRACMGCTCGPAHPHHAGVRPSDSQLAARSPWGGSVRSPGSTGQGSRSRPDPMGRHHCWTRGRGRRPPKRTSHHVRARASHGQRRPGGHGGLPDRIHISGTISLRRTDVVFALGPSTRIRVPESSPTSQTRPATINPAQGFAHNRPG